MARLREDVPEDSAARRVDEVDRARAREYALLATLLSRSPDARMLECLARLQGDASPLGQAHAALAEVAARANAETVRAEYFDLFDGFGGNRLLPYASYYLTGSLYGRPLAQLRQTLRSLGLERAERHSEPEDHAAILCELMAGVASGQIAVPAEAEREIFEMQLAPWMGRFFADLEHADSAEFYACVGTVGRTFIAIESEAFAFPDSAYAP